MKSDPKYFVPNPVAERRATVATTHAGITAGVGAQTIIDSRQEAGQLVLGSLGKAVVKEFWWEEFFDDGNLKMPAIVKHELAQRGVAPVVDTKVVCYGTQSGFMYMVLLWAGPTLSGKPQNFFPLTGYTFTGCAADYFQSAGTDVVTGVCTACLRAADYGGSVDATKAAKDFEGVAVMTSDMGCLSTGYYHDPPRCDLLAFAGCAANYFQSAGTDAATGVCTACDNGKELAAAAYAGAATACTVKAGYTLIGCAANYFQSAGTDAATGVCTACDDGQELAAAVFGEDNTVCNDA
jgi:hypothetical protein